MIVARLGLVLALLVAVAALPAAWHLPMGIAVWALLRLGAPDLHRTLGRPGRWLKSLVVLCALGACFGTADLSVGLSTSGALSGATMVVRAFALVALGTLASSALPVRRWSERVRHPAVRRLIEVVVVAANLVPVELRALSTAASALRDRRPGPLGLPKRMWLLAVHSSVRAAMLAESVAFEMALAAHNAGGRKES
jgi:hypothetical protein